jgi:hypothetical protein
MTTADRPAIVAANLGCASDNVVRYGKQFRSIKFGIRIATPHYGCTFFGAPFNDAPVPGKDIRDFSFNNDTFR